MEDVETSYYLRLRVADQPGVLADITRLLADSRISIEAMVQKEPGEKQGEVDIVMLTHRALERDVNQAMRKIEQLKTVLGRIVRIREEALL
jgi:homoserine dehydrogenase